MNQKVGQVIGVMGPVLDIRFPEGDLPELLNAVEIKNGNTPVVAEVAQHIGNHVARCIAMHATDGLRRGLDVVDTGAPICVPVGDGCLGRVFNLLGQPIDGGKKPEDLQRWSIHRPAPAYDTQKTTTQILWMQQCWQNYSM